MTDRAVDATSAVGNTSLGPAASRPSKTNPSDHVRGAEPSERLDARTRWWHEKNELVDEFVDKNCAAARPISVRETTKLREEVTSERHGSDGLRSVPWSSALREFLAWYNGYRYSHLRFRDPDGELVRAPMPNSHQPQYGDKYYAKLKALERRILAEFENPHVVMLTLTGSTSTATGGPRCPADHLREVVDPFGDHVRPALHRSLSGKRWEYAKVLEHHKSGYGHMHVAVFVDGAVDESDFHGAIDAHLKHCDIAGREAHDYYSADPDDRPISVSSVDPAASLKRNRLAGFSWLEGKDVNREDMELFGVGDMSSYVAEYIGAYGTDLFERDVSELAFRAVTWSTPTQRVTFSPGANELISSELDSGPDDDLPDTPAVIGEEQLSAEALATAKNPDDEYTFSDSLPDDAGGWTLDGIGVVDEEGETRCDVENSSVSYRTVENAEHIDPPNVQPSERPYRNLVKK